MDNQYKFLKLVCKLSNATDWVTYDALRKHWKNCPPEKVLINLAEHSYVEHLHEQSGYLFFPNPEAFSYVRQCQDSIRNLIVTSATLLVAVWTLLATIL